LYMMVFDELALLESHFIEEQKKGRRMADLYESVQHAGAVIPRLYLLVTVGAAYVKTKEAAVKLILSDLLDMVKGVQQPTRGLFLRYYLLKMMKDILPDKGNEFEGEGGDVNDSIEFILQNMSEMNRLWVRLQHLSTNKDIEQRQMERNELRVTVGENIIRLSSLEGVTFEIYKQIVLPRILEIVVVCKDTLAQQYLMECIIQAFPDEYHLQTLEQLLDTTSNLNVDVDIKNIFISLMDKLSKFAAQSNQGDESMMSMIGGNLDIFRLFKKYTDKIIEEQGRNIEVSKLLELEVAFMNFCIKTYPSNISYVNQILDSCCQILRSSQITNQDTNSMKLLVKLLTIPLDTLSIRVLKMHHYPTLMDYMKFTNKRTVALRICKAVIKDNKILTSARTVDQLLEFIKPLLIDDEQGGHEEPFEFEEGQECVSRLIHMIANKTNADKYYDLLTRFKRVFSKGGKNRQKYTYPALVFALIRLSQFMCFPAENAQEEVKIEVDIDGEQEVEPAPTVQASQLKIFKNLSELINSLQSHQPE